MRGRWQHYEPAWVARDPRFTHAHVTALAPFLARPTATDLATVAALAAATEPFDYLLEEVREFPDGCIHVPPRPAEPFTALTRALWAAFPQCPPYGTKHGIAPHVTLDQRSSTVSIDSTRTLLQDELPVSCRADQLELHWYEEGNCHVVATWRLGGEVAASAARRAVAFG